MAVTAVAGDNVLRFVGTGQLGPEGASLDNVASVRGLRRSY